MVREIQDSPLVLPALFHFPRQCRAGLFRRPGGGRAGKLIGITFGYKDQGGKRLIYAYDMARVRAELAKANDPPPAAIK